MFVEHIGKKGDVLKRTTKIHTLTSFCTSCRTFFTTMEGLPIDGVVTRSEWGDLEEGLLWCGGCKRVTKDIYFGRKKKKK